MDGICSIFWSRISARTAGVMMRISHAITRPRPLAFCSSVWVMTPSSTRSEEHTSELQSRGHLVCRLLLEKKKKNATIHKLHQRHTHRHLATFLHDNNNVVVVL